MVDVARQLLDELMGRNRNLDPSASAKEVSWTDEEFCPYYLVKFCPHDLFVNTRADLGQCTKLHDDEAKKLYDDAKPCRKKNQYEEDFLRFCTNMINEVDRKIVKGKQRLLLMNSKTDGARPGVPKHQEHLNSLTERINKLVREAEEAGTRGDVEQAQGLMEQCDKLKEEKEALIKQHDSNGWSVTAEIAASQEKQMEVCEVCGAFLIVGDAQQRIDDHLTGKQHLGCVRPLMKCTKQEGKILFNLMSVESEMMTVEDETMGNGKIGNHGIMTNVTITREMIVIEAAIDVISAITKSVTIVMIIVSVIDTIGVIDLNATNEIVPAKGIVAVVVVIRSVHRDRTQPPTENAQFYDVIRSIFVPLTMRYPY
ncbi:AGAP010454-PA-like protein [Anopheles sinensis]|uniref:AGAP010454-PA-like protein n=1 Tax=Anopheles sinensis TaxID=74873 RepID=A0A084VUM0_ANOSI|nr:AGAP010454-PA-like protein [Anopheles sinensis]